MAIIMVSKTIDTDSNSVTLANFMSDDRSA